jgi:ABC-type multidrug transport system fused ATPase/permease subunit
MLGSPGTGDAELAPDSRSADADDLQFRQLLALLMRCVPWLGRVKGHLGLLVFGWAGLGAVSMLLTLLFLIVLWNSILGDAPLSPWQASLFGQDPARTVGVETLSAPLRHALARHWTLTALILAPAITAAMFGLVYYQIWILQRVNQLLRLELVERLQTLSLRFHADSRVGDAIYRTYQDSAMVTQLIDVLLLAPLSSAGRYLAGLIGVSIFHPLLAVLLAAIWGPSLAFGSWISWRLRKRFRRARETNAALTSSIQETLAGIRVIKAYGLERSFQQRFERDSHDAFGAAYRARSLFATLGVVIFWIVSAAGLSAALYGVLQTRAGSATFAWGLLEGTGGPLEAAALGFGFAAWNLGLYNSFTFLFGSGNGAVQRMFHTWGRTQDIAMGLDRVFDLLDLEPEIQDRPEAVELEEVKDEIRFEDVSFAYEAARPVLHEVSFSATPGTVSAIVGPTGSGKTSLMALLLRLFDPSAGRIRVDGHDLRDLRVASLRHQISIALQENVLFGTTVRENIRYAVPDANDAQVREAARVACAEEFIEALPDGYDTLLGERGTKLSTGQRQRLSIARAVLKDTPVLILDEPTAALDAETELRLLDRLEAWGRGRFIFLITHRLSTIRRADRILVLEQGRLVEQGSHRELVSRPSGVYRALIEAASTEAA